MAFSTLQRQKDINEAVKIKEYINNEIIFKLHKILSKKYNLSRSDYILLIDKYQLQKNKNISRKIIQSLIIDLKLNKSFLEKTNTEIKYDKVKIPIMNDKLFSIHTRSSGLNKTKTKRNNYMSYEDTVTRDLKTKQTSEIKVKKDFKKNKPEKKNDKYDNIEEYEKKNLDDELKKLLDNRKYDSITGLDINKIKNKIKNSNSNSNLDYNEILNKDNLGSVYTTKQLPSIDKNNINYKLNNQINETGIELKIDEVKEPKKKNNIELNIDEIKETKKNNINLILNLIKDDNFDINDNELKFENNDNDSIIDDLDLDFENNSIFNEEGDLNNENEQENNIENYINNEKNINLNSTINYKNQDYIDNISEIKLLNCYVNSSLFETNFSNYPYIILRINQFENTLAINNSIHSGFCQIFFEKKGDNYNFNNNNDLFGIFKPKKLIKLEKIDVEIFSPNGKIINIKCDKNDIFNLVLKITTKQN